MRDLAAAAGVSLPTLLKIEKGAAVAEETSRKVQMAFLQHHVSLNVGRGEGAKVIPSGAGKKPLSDIAAMVRGLPYVAVRPRADGTHRVLFELPVRLRPPGWLATTPLPIQGRRGNLNDPKELRRIREDAAALYARLQRDRAAAGFRERPPT